MTDDLVSLFDDEPDPPSQDVRFRQGLIVTFDPVTLANTVRVGGATLTNLKLLGVGEATLLVPGATVGIMTVGGPAKTMFILGRAVTPNTADATNAVSLLNSQIYSQFIITGETTASTTYTDLATVGPVVTVPVGPSGRILVLATAQIQWATVGALGTGGGGLFDVAFAGANTRTPNEVVDPLVGLSVIQITTATNNSQAGFFSATTQAVFSALNPGDTTITMKYRHSTVSTAVNTDFHRRTLTVFKL